MENDELKRNLSDITNDNSKIKSKLLDLEKKFANLERDYTERLGQKEEELNKNYEKILQDLEENKEKNINKISKENHELKQQNDDLQKQIQKLLLKSKAFESQDRPAEKSENKQMNQNSSPILIINEMMTPSSASMYKTSTEKAKDPKTNTVLQQKTFGGLAPINESQQEENNSSGETRTPKKPESLKKMSSGGLNPQNQSSGGMVVNSNNNNNSINNGTNPNSLNNERTIINTNPMIPRQSSMVVNNNSNNTNNNNVNSAANNEKNMSSTINTNPMIPNQSSLIYSQTIPQNQSQSTSINSQLNSQMKIAEINQNKLLQAKTSDGKTQLRNPFAKDGAKEATNNSFGREKTSNPNPNDSKPELYKTDSQNSQSRTDLRASNIMNSFNPFKQSAEMAAKKDVAAGRDKKVIMFNLMENHKKMSEGVNSGYMGNYSSNKY